jgi:hypothetical protein
MRPTIGATPVAIVPVSPALPSWSVYCTRVDWSPVNAVTHSSQISVPL